MNQKHNLEFFVALFFKLLSLALGTVLIYWMLLKITGHTPTMDQILIASLIAIVSFLFKISSDLSGLKSEFREYAKYNDRRVSELTADLKNHIASHS